MAAVDASGRREAYFTMITTKDYIIGALVMAHSLRGSGATRPILCMVTRNIEDKDLEALRAGGLTPVVVGSIPAPSLSHVSEWDNAGYTKINLWGLIDWDVIVYIDADCLVLSNMDDLFLRNTRFAAAPDVFPPDRFNAGVLIVQPSRETFDDMVSKVGSIPSYDGGDTGFLNGYFPNWFLEGPDSRLPFGCNALRTMHWMTRKTPGYWGAVAPLRCIHFCSFPKPWQQAPRGELERAWWVAFATCQLALRRTAPAFAAVLSALPRPASAGADAAQGGDGAGTDAPREDWADGGVARRTPDEEDA